MLPRFLIPVQSYFPECAECRLSLRACKLHQKIVRFCGVIRRVSATIFPACFIMAFFLLSLQRLVLNQIQRGRLLKAVRAVMFLSMLSGMQG